MTTKGERTRDRMLATTAELLRCQGYHATGLLQIVERSQTPKGSLYFHFPGGKDELAAEALRHAATSWRAVLSQVLSTTAGDLAGDLVRICDRLAAELESSGYAHGCPLATVTLETAAENEALREVAAEHYRGWEELISERLRAEGMPAERAGAAATLVLSSIEGALLLSRAYHDTTPLRRVAALLPLLAAD
jgi:TetR/AcrR family transcriptional repressor of lmrAB and yxaGH operons